MSSSPQYCNFIFKGYPENIIISIEREKQLKDLINEYFKNIKKSNLIYRNVDNIYFIIDAKIITSQTNGTIESFFKNNASSTFLVEVVNGRNHNNKENFQIDSIIKENLFTNVYRAKVDFTNELVAVKKIKKEKIIEQIKNQNMENKVTDEDFQKLNEKFNKEIEFMEKCQCENSVAIYDYYDTESDFIIIMELCDKTLFDLLIETQNGFSSEEIKNILLQLKTVFEKMNYYNIVHRDIKLNNILIKYLDQNKTQYKVLLSDYGISNQINSITQKLDTYIGTRLLMAPEILESLPYTNKCDLWSLGIIIYQLYTKRLPYEGNVDKQILKNIDTLGQKVLDKIDDKDKLLKDLLSKLLVKDPEKRISWENYFTHPFFN